MLKVAIFDDVVFARGEVFHIQGLSVDVYEHADQAAELCVRAGHDIVFMDYGMGEGHDSGAQAIKALRSAGFRGRIVATSSNPSTNAEMQAAGADEVLLRKAHLRSYLVRLGAEHLASTSRS